MKNSKVVLGSVFLLIFALGVFYALKFHTAKGKAAKLYIEVTAFDENTLKHTDQYKQNFTKFEFDKIEIVDYEKAETNSSELAYEIKLTDSGGGVLDVKNVGFSTEVLYTTCSKDSVEPCKDRIYGELKTSFNLNKDAKKVQLYKDKVLLVESILPAK